MQDLSKFDPNVETLNALVGESVSIVTVDINDPTQIEVVKKARIKLRDARVLIEKTGKSYRDDAIKYQRDVLEKERSLIAIIEPEELRLKAFEEESKKQKELAIRREQLPARKERLATLGFEVGISITEHDILNMDSVHFETRVNELVAAKNAEQKRKDDEAAAKVAADLKKREDDLKEGERKLAAEKDAREREERARQEERDRIEREARDKKEREEREERERKEREAKEKAELERQKKYKKFLTDNGYTKETAEQFKQEKTSEGVVLWKKIAVYKGSQ